MTFEILRHRWMLDLLDAGAGATRIASILHKGLVKATLAAKLQLRSSDFTSDMRHIIKKSKSSGKLTHQEIIAGVNRANEEVLVKMSKAAKRGSVPTAVPPLKVNQFLDLADKTVPYNATTIRAVGLSLNSAKKYDIKSVGNIKPNSIVAGTTAFGGIQPPIFVSQQSVESLVNGFKKSSEFTDFSKLDPGQKILRVRNYIRDKAFDLTDYDDPVFRKMLKQAGEQIDLQKMLDVGHADCRGHAAANEALLQALQEEELLEKSVEHGYAYLFVKKASQAKSATGEPLPKAKLVAEEHAIVVARWTDRRGEAREAILDAYFTQYNGNLGELHRGVFNKRAGHWKKKNGKWVSVGNVNRREAGLENNLIRILSRRDYVNIAVPRAQ